MRHSTITLVTGNDHFFRGAVQAEFQDGVYSGTIDFLMGCDSLEDFLTKVRQPEFIEPGVQDHSEQVWTACVTAWIRKYSEHAKQQALDMILGGTYKGMTILQVLERFMNPDSWDDWDEVIALVVYDYQDGGPPVTKVLS